VFYLNGGRYVTTDDAYVGAQKVLITPDISGKIISVAVKEGQQVSTGDTMFQIDPVPFQLALAQARAKLDDAKASHDNFVANVKLYDQTIEIINAGIAIKQRDVERYGSAALDVKGYPGEAFIPGDIVGWIFTNEEDEQGMIGRRLF